MKYKIALMMSGSGSNVRAIVNHDSKYEVGAIITTNAETYDNIQNDIRRNIPIILIERKEKTKDTFERIILSTLSTQNLNHDYAVLALCGYKYILSDNFITIMHDVGIKIINIHPSLLPKYKGFYGSRIHNIVFCNQDEEHGITIHEVDHGEIDSGPIILQKKIAMYPPHEGWDESPEWIEHRIHRLEHAYYPYVLDKLILGHENV